MLAIRIQSRGFTRVEIAMTLVVLAALMASVVPFLREQKRLQLQELTNTEPWEVFEFRAQPTKGSFFDNEDVVIRCEIENLTSYPLSLPVQPVWRWNLQLTSAGVDIARLLDGEVVIPDAPIEAGATVRFEARFRPKRLGKMEAQIAFSHYRARRISTPWSNSFGLIVEPSGDFELSASGEIKRKVKIPQPKIRPRL